VASDYSIGIFNVLGKNIEDTNRVIRCQKNKGEQTAKWPKEKGKTLKIPIE
jgi:hypothetical protein